jgi:hypothetical protein
MNDAIKELTPSGKIKRPSYSLVANWVKDSWDAIDPNMIKRSFKCCGISNNINGSEDDLIFDFSKLENVNNPGRGVEEENEDENTNEDDDNGSECESDDSESDYYERNEECNVIHDWR